MTETISVGKGSENGSIDGTNTYSGYTEQTENEIRNLARELTQNSKLHEEGDDDEFVDDVEDLNQHVQKNKDSPAYQNLAGLHLLRTMTSMSQVPGTVPIEQGTNTEIDPRLDPSSDDFSSRFWVKNMRKIMDADADYYKPTSLGFVAKNLVARGISSDADYQANFLNFPFKKARDIYLETVKANDKSRYFDILKSMDCLIKPGTLTVVLGRPGAGCSTFLKTVAAQTYGFKIDKDSVISYNGLTPKEIDNNYRGEVIFSAEMDNHFPHLSVGQTLQFASELRTPQNRFPGIDRKTYADHMAKVSFHNLFIFFFSSV